MPHVRRDQPRTHLGGSDAGDVPPPPPPPRSRVTAPRAQALPGSNSYSADADRKPRPDPVPEPTAAEKPGPGPRPQPKTPPPVSAEGHLLQEAFLTCPNPVREREEPRSRVVTDSKSAKVMTTLVSKLPDK
ncbi:anther-specific proline-rich protein APG-like [Cervus elaphus]|uniref:anther-specific proline-rich protein APG-like n=1 Tax=Cervus elaphus TaxID=9860 RepID=UPI001CC2E753|nr:anther-specific proline-rich protein APG-like [Cervus elaphus]